LVSTETLMCGVEGVGVRVTVGVRVSVGVRVAVGGSVGGEVGGRGEGGAGAAAVAVSTAWKVSATMVLTPGGAAEVAAGEAWGRLHAINTSRRSRGRTKILSGGILTS